MRAEEDEKAQSGRRPVAYPRAPVLAVVGNGMVTQHFCEEAVRRGLTELYRIEVYGEESRAAYDRVNLGKIIDGESPEELELKPPAWHDEQGIDLRTGARVRKVDPDEGRLTLEGGRKRDFDALVLATGARPRLPKLEGVGSPNVLVYRTVEDALEIRRRCLALATASEPVVIVGGGLLGLELAEQVHGLGPRVVVVENQESLLPRQLDSESGGVLLERMKRDGLDFQLGRRVEGLADDSGAVEVTLAGQAKPCKASLVIFAMGIVPRDELARKARLQCDLFGGVDVDRGLRTSHPKVYAMGECARFQGVTYGLVAPGYRMAEVLVDRLLGGNSVFEGAELTTHLKRCSVAVTAVGDSAGSGLDMRSVVYRDETSHRRLTLHSGRVVGATVIGEWDQVPAVQQAVARELPFRWWEERRFRTDRPVWSSKAISPAAWPDTATVCGCTGVTCGALRAAIGSGADNVDALAERTGAGNVCGGCRPLVAALCSPTGAVEASAVGRWLLGASLLALIAVVAVVFFGPVPYADSVQSIRFDVLWRDPFWRQVTGFSLAGLMVLGGLYSVRKRWLPARWGSLGGWRALHAAAGAVAVALTVLHTGMRLGVNLDAALMGAFLASTAVGALLGVVSSKEADMPPGMGVLWRQRLARWHLWLVWPLPVLIGFHVFKFYYF